MPAPPPTDSWPHTSRVMPWLLAGFVAMIFLLPFDSIEAPVSIGLDAKLDRLAILLLLAAWLLSFLGGGRAGVRLSPNLVFLGVAAFLTIALLSVTANVGVLANLGELELAVKKLVLLCSYVAFFFVVATTVRAGELRAFARLVVGLACLTSLGVIYEFRTGTNLFYELSSSLLSGFTVASEPPDPDIGAASIVGPTQHGLAVTALLSMPMAFALAEAVEARGRARIGWLLATGLILIGVAATQKKAALAAAPIVFIAIGAYRPRQVLRLAPLAVVAVAAIMVVAPGALGTIKSRVSGASQRDASTVGRTRDYDAIKPDVASRPWIGRGYGSYDPATYRILDNDYLGMLIEIGALGLLAFAAMVGSVLVAAYRPIRSRDPVRGPPALGATGAAVAFLVVTALFDSLSFAQAPYLLFFVAGVASVAAVAAPRSLGRRRLRPVEAPA